MSRLVAFCLALLCAAVVAWVHLLPTWLGGVEDPADRVARFQVQRQVAAASNGRLRGRELERQTDDWIRLHPSEFAAQRAALVERYRSALRYTAENGKAYTYLGDQDSYTWIRAARNYLRHGTTCDEIVDGVCRDTMVNAPLGAQLVYNRSVHIAAIVALQRLLNVFDPLYPLTATAFWIPIIVAVLGVFPAFWIGARLAGPVAGIGAALLSALHPIVLQRSIGSDNDIWNVVLPLYMNAAAMAALLSSRRRAQIGWATVAGIVAGLHAVTWNGWIFAYAVLVTALLATLALQALAVLLRRWLPRPAPVQPNRAQRRRAGNAPSLPPAVEPAGAPSLRANLATPAVVLGVFYLVAGIAAFIIQPKISYFDLPRHALQRIFGDSRLTDIPKVENAELWPGVLNTVSELQGTSFASIQADAFNRQYFAAAVVGLLLLLVPIPPWTKERSAALAIGLLWLIGLSAGPEIDRNTAVVLAAVPLLLGALLRATRAAAGDDALLGPMLIVVTWFLAGLFAAFQGARLIMLLAPPLGLAIGIGFGRLHRLAADRLGRALPRRQRWIHIALAALLCLVYLPAARSGYATARNYLPAMDDTWWDTLVNLRQKAAPDAIINVWWDYGYWAKYVAERRVTADGSMLLTHLPYWMGKVLVSATERQSAGLLRMLSCGSDATPLPEGSRGAYGLIHAKLRDTLRAHETVLALAARSRAEAAAYLSEQGFSSDEQAAVLAVTHCTPPETYLIIGTDLTAKDSWMRMAAWDFERAYIFYQAANLPEAEALADITRRFGYSPQQAAVLHADARRLSPTDFIIGPAPRAPSVWYSCQPGSTPGLIRCPLGLFDLNSKKLVEEFVFNTFAPERSVLRYRRAEPGRPPSAPIEQAPGALVVADSALQDITLPERRYADTGVLVDTRKWRILVGPAPLIRSTFTHLLFLDGRYARYYEKVDERVSHTEDRLQTWRLRSPQD